MNLDYDPTDVEAQRLAKLANEDLLGFQRGQEQEDLKWVMSDSRGRRFMWRLLGGTGPFRNAFAGDDSRTCFNLGMQNVGQMLLAALHEACPEKYLQMTKEAKKDAKRRDTER